MCLDKATLLNVFDAIIASGDRKSERPFVVSFYPNAELHQKKQRFSMGGRICRDTDLHSAFPTIKSKILECQKQQFVMTK